MALRSCRECHQRVSTEARACPHCGAARPVPADDLRQRLTPRWALLGIAVVLFASALTLFRQQARWLSGTSLPPAYRPPAEFERDYVPLTMGLRVGAALYHRQDTTYAGRITSLLCPSDWHRRPGIMCLEIELPSSRRVWGAWPGAEQLFIAKRP